MALWNSHSNLIFITLDVSKFHARFISKYSQFCIRKFKIFGENKSYISILQKHEDKDILSFNDFKNKKSYFYYRKS